MPMSRSRLERSGVLGGPDGDVPARSVIEEQDRLIAERTRSAHRREVKYSCPGREKHASRRRQKKPTTPSDHSDPRLHRISDGLRGAIEGCDARFYGKRFLKT